MGEGRVPLLALIRAYIARRSDVGHLCAVKFNSEERVCFMVILGLKTILLWQRYFGALLLEECMQHKDSNRTQIEF